MTRDQVSHPLPIRISRTLDGNGETALAETVLCPSRGSTMDVEDCLACRHAFGRQTAPPSVACTHPAARRMDHAPRPVRLPSPAELTAVSEIMTGDVRCVTADVSVATLGSLMLDRNISAVPVVNATRRAVGMVSKSDLVRWYHDEMVPESAGETADDLEPGLPTREVPANVVDEIMTPLAFSLTEDAPIAYAAALMAVEGVHHLAIVDGDGRVVGIVSALDIVRWLAHHDGFIVPSVRQACPLLGEGS